MSRRSGDWHLLGHATDPVPASEYDVDRVASTYVDRGRDLRETHQTLERLSRLDGWRGDAAEAFAESADDRLSDLDKAATKYESAGTALRAYADDVATARTVSRSALTEAEDADRRRRDNAGNPLAGVQEPTEQQIADLQLQADRHERAVVDLEAAQARLSRALDDLDGAARRCARAIGTASDRFKDHWFKDNLVRHNLEFFKIACKVLEIAAVAIAVVALGLALLATAPLALIVAGVAAAALLVLARSALVVSDTGTATWADVGWDVVGLGLSVVGGRASLRLARSSGALGGTFNALRTAATASARGRLPFVPRFMLRFSGSRNPLLRPLGGWAQGRLDDLARPALSRIDSISTLRVGWGSRLRVLDTEMATMRAQLAALDRLTLPGVNVQGIVRNLDDLKAALGPAIRWNLINTGVSADGAADVVTGGTSLSGVVRSEIAEETSQAHWRLTVAGR